MLVCRDTGVDLIVNYVMPRTVLPSLTVNRSPCTDCTISFSASSSCTFIHLCSVGYTTLLLYTDLGSSLGNSNGGGAAVTGSDIGSGTARLLLR